MEEEGLGATDPLAKGQQEVNLTNKNYKVFSCKDKSINHKWINIVSDLPQEYILLTRKIISMFEKEYNKKLNEIIYVSLTEQY